MSNYDALNLYLVSEGVVTPADADTECDGYNSIIVAATNTEAALELARRWDNGEIGVENIAWHGVTVAALYSRDELGNYE